MRDAIVWMCDAQCVTFLHLFSDGSTIMHSDARLALTASSLQMSLALLAQFPVSAKERQVHILLVRTGRNLQIKLNLVKYKFVIMALNDFKIPLSPSFIVLNIHINSCMLFWG
jgi:hypothetical protein